jgi:hypothetical protein
MQQTEDSQDTPIVARALRLRDEMGTAPTVEPRKRSAPAMGGAVRLESASVRPALARPPIRMLRFSRMRMVRLYVLGFIFPRDRPGGANLTGRFGSVFSSSGF